MKLQLFNTLKNENFSVEFKKLTGSVFFELQKIFETFRDIKREVKIFYILAKTNPETLSSSFLDNNLNFIIDGIKDGSLSEEDIVLLFETQYPDVLKQNFTRTIKIIQTVINFDGLSAEQINLINTDPTSDFWQNQSIEELSEVVEFFRSKIRK